MKKSIAAIGAAVVGVAGVGLSATPAQAAVPACATVGDHVVSSTSPAAGAFYMDCVPQYGLGKAEFTITGAPSYAEGDGQFDLSNDADATATTTLPASLAGYSTDTFRGGFTDLERQDSESVLPGTQVYDGVAALPIVSAQKIATSALPSACLTDTSSYQSAYKITYGSAVSTFVTTNAAAQSVGGKPGKYVVTVQSAPLYLGLTFDSGDSNIDTTKSLCAASGENATQSDAYGLDYLLAEVTQVLSAGTAGPSLAPTNSYSGPLELATSHLQSVLSPVTTSLVAKGASYGKAPTVAFGAKADGVAATGVATVKVDGKVAASKSLVNGGISVPLSASLPVGKHSVTVSYAGNALTAAASVSSTITISKGVSTTSAKLAATAKVKKTKLSVKISVAVPGTKVTATGKVSVKVGTTTLKSVALKNGTITVTLPKFAKTGSVKVKVSYLGSGSVNASTATYTVKVKK